MNSHHHIIIAGAGGIARAAALILAEWSKVPPTIYLGNRTFSKAQKVTEWVKNGNSKSAAVQAFHLTESPTETMKSILENGDILLDCLPGKLAPRMAQLAKDFQMHYVNLTEYVAETNEITELAKNAKTGFILQSGLAPGYIDILANGLFQDFCKTHNVDKVDKLEFKVGALTDHAVSPHYYGFTWSPVGVATEYVEDVIAIRNFKKTILPALSEQRRIIIDGVSYDEDLTSGGAADLPDALAGKVCTLDYKTLRHPGHYDWVKDQISSLPKEENNIQFLQQKMEAIIPRMEDDRIILYAAVEGKNAKGELHRMEIARKILPQKVGKHTLRAIQTTTAVPMLQAAQLLLESSIRGVLLQSQIAPKAFLNGDFITPVYGAY